MNQSAPVKETISLTIKYYSYSFLFSMIPSYWKYNATIQKYQYKSYVMAIVCFVHFLRCASGSVICLQHSQRAVLANSTVQVHRLSGTEGERIHCLQPRKKYESGFNSNAKARQRNMGWMVFIACCLHIIRFSSLIVVNIRTEYVVQAALLPRTHFAIDTCNVYWSRITDNNRINC